MRQNPDALCLWSVRHGSVSFARFGEMAALQQSQALRRGLNAGDVVVVMALPSPQLYALLIAMMGLGCPIVFIEPWMPAAHIEASLSHCNPKAIFTDAFGQLWRLRSHVLRALPRFDVSQTAGSIPSGGQLQILPVVPSTPAIISFTSGTTGHPKGVVRTHEYLWNLHEILVKYGEDESVKGPDLTIFPNLVLFNIGNGRGSLLVPANWSLNALQRVRELDKELWPQTLSCGPAFIRRLVEYNLCPPSLRNIHIGGALVECDLLESLIRLLPRTVIKQVYGGTEVEPVAFCDAQKSLNNSRRKGYLHALNVGFPISEIKVRWDERGALWVAGPNVCPEYLGSSEENFRHKKRDEDGTLWHCMGDRILSDEDGLWYCGRVDQPAQDFLFEQKMYARLGHARAFLHRDLNNNGIVVADDDRRHVEKVGLELSSEKFEVWSAIITRDRRHRARIDRKTTWQRGLRMQRWKIYLKERSPLFILLLLATGPLFSGYFLSQVHGSCADSPRGVCLQSSFGIAAGITAVIASVMFMVLARMMDELKDFEKDKIANPNRPLPRGLISPQEMSSAILYLFLLLLALSSSFFFTAAPLSAALMIFSTLYLWLMYKEFYVGAWLANYPLWYALSHQVVGVPLYLFGVTLFAPSFASEPLSWMYVGANVFSSVAYEFTRKLKPDAHAAARTYRQIYGLKISAFIAMVFNFAAMGVVYTAQQSGFSGLAALFVLQIIFAFMLLWQMLKDSLHKQSEGIAALVVLLSAWMGVFVVFRF
jgi:4-hydroxybenzoate polyprenyltransferase